MKPADLGLLIPSWREGQLEAIYNSKFSGKRFVGQCMPTGSGKSHTLVGEHCVDRPRTLILTGTKELQNQYTNLFKNLGIVDIRGKSNYSCYATELGGEFYMSGVPAKSVAEGPCQAGVECGLRLGGCSFYDRVRQVSSPSTKLTVANYASWISSNMYTEGWGYFPLILCDEAHEVESWLGSMLSIRVPHSFAGLLELDLPTSLDVDEWVNWSQFALSSARYLLMQAEESSSGRSKRSLHKKQIQVIALRLAERVLTRLRAITPEWRVFEERGGYLFHPIQVHRYAEALLFNGARKVVFASSTIVPHSLHSIGVPANDLDFFEYPSTFPVERRPIYYYPVVKMSYDMDAEDNLSWIGVADEFISQRLDRKGFMPTVSFARAKQFLEHSRFAELVCSNLNGASATATLQKFRLMKPPAILVTPSMSTGVDLYGKQSEYTIVPKMPFPNIKDPFCIARSEHDPEFGPFEAAKSLVQSTGRSMRHDMDQNETLITDAVFATFMTRWRHLIAQWWWDGVRQVDELPQPLEAL